MEDMSWFRIFCIAGGVYALCVLCFVYGYVEGRDCERERRQRGIAAARHCDRTVGG
jgi:hypothetical protein